MEQDILNQLEKFSDKHILVLGDFILDVYVNAQCERLAPEASIPVLDVKNIEYNLGGAANVANNLKKLGAQVSFLTVLGQDDYAKKAIQLYQSEVQQPLYIHFSIHEKTLCKTRILKDNQLTMRLDEGKHVSLANQEMDIFLNDLTKLYMKCDAVYIADYNKGCIHYRIIDLLETLKLKVNKPIVIDSKNYLKYKNIHPYVIKPNYQEALAITQENPANDRIKHAQSMVEKILDDSNAALVTITLDKDGVFLARKNSTQVYLETCKVEVKNTSGAGDIFLATFLLSQLAGMNDISAAKTACTAATLGVCKSKTAYCTQEELKMNFLQSTDKVVYSLEHLAQLTWIMSNNQKVVLTTGCFDIFHSGHAKFLKQAKEQGDILIIGINTDESISRLKGPLRPINTLIDRMEVLKALHYVDYIIPFGSQKDDTPISLIKSLKPHVFVKGEEYQQTLTPEKKILMNLGIQQIFIPLVPHQSTTKIINRVQDKSINLKKIS